MTQSRKTYGLNVVLFITDHSMGSSAYRNASPPKQHNSACLVDVLFRSHARVGMYKR